MPDNQIWDDLQKMIGDAAFYGSLGDDPSVSQLKIHICVYVSKLLEIVQLEGANAMLQSIVVNDAINDYRNMTNTLNSDIHDN